MALKFVKGVALLGASLVASSCLGGVNGAELAKPIPLDSTRVKPRPLGNTPAVSSPRSDRPREGTTDLRTVYHEITVPRVELHDVKEEVRTPGLSMPGGFGSRTRPAIIAQPAVIEAKPSGRPTLIPGQGQGHVTEEAHRVQTVHEERKPVQSETHEVAAPGLSMPGGFGSRSRPAIIAQPAVIEAKPSGKPTLIPGENLEEGHAEHTTQHTVYEERPSSLLTSPEEGEHLQYGSVQEDTQVPSLQHESREEVVAPVGLTMPGGFGSNRKPAVIAQPAVIEAKPSGKPELIPQGHLRGSTQEEVPLERHQLVLEERINPDNLRLTEESQSHH